MPAKMIPEGYPSETESRFAEPLIYWRLAKQLSKEFTVIHSLKWLSGKRSKSNNKIAPTGEIDFLVLHDELGILAVEVKGGKIRYEQNSFIYNNSGMRFDPVSQVRNGTHGLAEWLGGSGIFTRIGYAISFPNADMKGRLIPPALEDRSIGKAENICIDMNDMSKIGDRVIEIMKYWRQVLGDSKLSVSRLEKIINFICPVQDYSPRWTTRIENDQRTWLILTEEQTECLKLIERQQSQVIEGRSGTGKTIIAVAKARELADQGNKVLFLTYNLALAKDKLQPELANSQIDTINFHELCRRASRLLGRNIPTEPTKLDEWNKLGAPIALHDAIQSGKMPKYNALIIDEGQVFAENWLVDLTSWFDKKKIFIFCDETQVFPFEKEQHTSTHKIAEIIHAGEPYTLTINLRSPRSVFERIKHTIPTSYQQISMRPNEEDALTEYAVFNPLEKLHEVLKGLHKEGVPSKAITVIYTQHAPNYETGIEKYIRSTESIFRFRGLESPVVVIYAPNVKNDTVLLCAYTRATSRCIAIFDARDFINKKHNIQLIDQFEKSKYLPIGLEPILERFGKARITTPLQEVIVKTASVSWSSQWKGWVIQENSNSDVVSAHLWRNYLCQSSRFPVFYVSTDFYSGTHVDAHSNVRILTDTPIIDRQYIELCPHCNRWTRMIYQESNRTFLCQECNIHGSGQEIPKDEIQIILRYQDILLNWSTKEALEKRNLPIQLFALAYWRTLSPSHQTLVASKLNYFSGCLADDICDVFIAIDIAKLSPGEVILLDDLRNKYQSPKWYPNLKNQIDIDLWKKIISRRISRWISYNLIQKKSKNTSGVYIRLPLENVSK
jgi:Uncharacterized conserved protein (DUF2075)